MRVARGHVGERIMVMAEVNLLRDAQFAYFLQKANYKGQNPKPQGDLYIDRRVMTGAIRDGMDLPAVLGSRGPGAAAMGGRFVWEPPR